MANHKTFSQFLQEWKEKSRSSVDMEPPESHRRGHGLPDRSRILDVERAERAERAAVLQRAQRLHASQQAHANAVLKRLGLSVQQDTPASPERPASPRRSTDSPSQGRRLRPILKVPPLSFEEENESWPYRTNRILEEDPFFEKKLRLGSKMAIVAGKMASLTAPCRSPSSDGSRSSLDTVCTADTHTPSELRAISRLGSPTVAFTPTPPQTAATRRRDLLEKVIGGGNEIINGRPLQSPKIKGKKTVERKVQVVPRPPPQRTAPPKRTVLVPAAPSKAAATNRGGPRCGTKEPVKANKQGVKDDLQPLANPVASLSLCLSQLITEDWEKKMNGFKSVRALARHHPQVLLTKLHEVCLVLAEEVKNLRSVVASAAMETIAELHIHLGKAMDPEAERTGRALLLKLSQTTSVFIHQQVNLALDELVKGCSPGRVVSALFNTGLSHRCAAVRASTAQHLHQLADIIGEEWFFTAGKIFSDRFVTAVTKMALDAAPEVRHYAHKMLQELAQQKQFMEQWNKVVPVKDRRPLEKLLRKLK